MLLLQKILFPLTGRSFTESGISIESIALKVNAPDPIFFNPSGKFIDVNILSLKAFEPIDSKVLGKVIDDNIFFSNASFPIIVRFADKLKLDI